MQKVKTKKTRRVQVQKNLENIKKDAGSINK